MSHTNFDQITELTSYVSQAEKKSLLVQAELIHKINSTYPLKNISIRSPIRH